MRLTIMKSALPFAVVHCDLMPRPPAPGRFVVRMLEDSASPIFALDAQRKIVFANRALGDWLGINSKELVGKLCSYAATVDDPVTAACAALCPPPEAFMGEASDGAVSRLASDKLSFERRRARFVFIDEYDAAGKLVLVIILPIDVLEAGDDATQTTPERLHALLLKLRSQLG